jgi:hypothetical protein
MKHLIACVVVMYFAIALSATPSPAVQALWQTTSSFRYITRGDDERWLAPRAFEAAGGGLCCDFATYMVWLAAQQNIALDVVLVQRADGKLHALVDTGTYLLEPQRYGALVSRYSVIIAYRLTFDQLRSAIGFSSFGFKE